jgi:hypothetical protein
MPHYHFALCDGGLMFDDPDGTTLADIAAARAHAQDVAREVMRHCEPKTRHCKLEVRDAAGAADEVLFEVAFAAVDPTLDNLDPTLRGRIEQISATIRAAKETVFESRMMVLRCRAVEARLARRPYLITENGRQVGPIPGSVAASPELLGRRNLS